MKIKNPVKKKLILDLRIGGSRDKDTGVVPSQLLMTMNGNHITVPENQLPIKLPENINLKTTGNPLDHQEDWRKITIKGKKYKLETDTLDTFVRLIMVLPSFLFSKQFELWVIILKKLSTGCQ